MSLAVGGRQNRAWGLTGNRGQVIRSSWGPGSFGFVVPGVAGHRERAFVLQEGCVRGAGDYLLAERCGPARAKEVVFSAETYDAATFELWNIVNRVVPGDDLREAALALAQQLTKGPTLAHAVTKQLVRRALDHGSREADRYLLDVATPLLESHDIQHTVDLLLTHGARKFIQNHAKVVFESLDGLCRLRVAPRHGRPVAGEG